MTDPKDVNPTIKEGRIEKYIEKLLEDNSFKEECKKILKEIMRDGKLDMADTPYIVSLVTLIYCSNSKIKIKKVDLPEVLTGVVMKLLDEININLGEREKNTLKNMIETSM